jgi:hypothetical protein
LNSAFGYGALANATATDGNTAVGAYSLNANTTATSNSAFGYQALTANTTGSSNNAFGYQSLPVNTTGSANSAFGVFSLNVNTTGNSNTGFGHRTLLALGAGDFNVGVGNNAFYSLTSGSRNTAVGGDSAYNHTSGSNNTFVGYLAGTDVSHGALTNAAAIGAYAQVTQSNSLVLGGLGANAVSVGIGTSAPNTTLQVVGDVRVGTSGTNGCLQNFAGTALSGTCSSDARLKTNVRPFAPVLDRLVRLQPVHFTWKASEFPEYHFGAALNSGLIAQEVERVFPEMVDVDARGYKMVNYSELPYLTLAAVRELKAENDGLRERVGSVEAQNETLRAQVVALAERLARLETRDRH